MTAIKMKVSNLKF